jgi:hypothetical protein
VESQDTTLFLAEAAGRNDIEPKENAADGKRGDYANNYMPARMQDLQPATRDDGR